MRLSKEATKEFKEIYYKEFKQKISEKQAREMGANLLSLFKIIYRPLPNFGKQNGSDNKSNQSPGQS